MALVTVTYNAWDHSREVIPASLMPEVWFRPVKASIAAGLMTDREIKGTLNPSTGAGSVQLESLPGVSYVPSVRWLIDKTLSTESEPNRARGYCEWPAIFPGPGGDIESLPTQVVLPSGVVFGFGPPDPAYAGVIYIDISGANPVIYGPEGAV